MLNARCRSVIQFTIIIVGMAEAPSAWHVASATDVTAPLSVNASATPEVIWHQTGNGMNTPSHRWSLAGDQNSFFLYDYEGASVPLNVESGAPPSSFHISDAGNIGLGTRFTKQIMGVEVPGRILNLRTDEPGTAGLARMVAQGSSGAQLHLVHLDGPVNQRVLRVQNTNGIASFNVVKDDLAANLVTNALVIKLLNGNIGLKQGNPTHPLHLASGAHCTAGGVWTNASSRELKEEIEPISSQQAQEAIRALQPVGYRYKSDPDERYVGFIAEDVPDLVATNDRKSLASMDITAVLTRVVQDQDRMLSEQQQTISKQEQLLSQQQRLLGELGRRLTDLEQKSDACSQFPR